MFKTVTKTFFTSKNWKSIPAILLTILGSITSIALTFVILSPTNLFFYIPAPNTAYAASLNANSEKVIVYVVDSGIDPTRLTELQNHTLEGYDAILDTPEGTDDCTGHGTSVAGVIARNTDHKKVTIVPVKVIDCEGIGNPIPMVKGIKWVIDNHPENAPTGIINISLGYTDTIPFLDNLQNAVQEAIDKGFVVVVSAGNDSTSLPKKDIENVVADACRVAPAHVSDAITVGSARHPKHSEVFRSAFSNSGSCVDVFAPGEGITIVKQTDNGDWGVSTGFGTSFAAPLVAAIIANKVVIQPDADRVFLENYIKENAVSGLIRDTAKIPLNPTDPVYPDKSTPNLFIKLMTKENGGKTFFKID